MDETKGKTQDTSPKEGDSSGGAGGSTSPKTFTEAQVQKAVNDALAKAGRDAKSFEAREKTIKEAQAKADEWQRQQDEAEAEKHRDNPDGLKALRTKQELKKAQDALKKAQDDFEAEKASHAEKLTRAEETELELSVWKAAQAKGIDAGKLKEKCLKFGLKTEEQITDMAETMSDGKTSAEEPPLHTDSGKGKGGSKDFSTVSFEPNAPSSQEMISKGLNKK